MKKIVGVFLAILFLLGLSSCKKKDEELVYRMDCNYSIKNYSYDGDMTSYLNTLGFDEKNYIIIKNSDDKNNFDNLITSNNELHYISTHNKQVDIDFDNNDLVIMALYDDSVSSFELSVSGIEYEKNVLKVMGCLDKSSIGECICRISFIFIKITDKNVTSVVDNILVWEAVEPIYRVYKPVIYLYSDERINLNIKFRDESRLKTTYPKYNSGWDVVVDKDKISDGTNEYYALFYDEDRKHSVDFSEGFYVENDNAINFLEEKLDILGFNYKEKNEFIMYWLPILEDNKQSLVYFEQTEERNNECPLELSINPDSMLRVIIHIKKVDKYTSINEEKLYSFERNGFTFVEWGGTTY